MMGTFPRIITTVVLLFTFLFSHNTITYATDVALGGDPVVIELKTNHASVEDALIATKQVLLGEKFIVQGSIQESSFTAKRTTGAEADYYIADVSVKRNGDSNTVTITFVKVGTGLLKLSKVADKVKAELEK